MAKPRKDLITITNSNVDDLGEIALTAGALFLAVGVLLTRVLPPRYKAANDVTKTAIDELDGLLREASRK